MNELIKVTEKDGKKLVSARELYEFLGFDKSQWSRWYKKNIENMPFAVEFEDWQGFDTMSNGNKTKDFAITVDFAKRLSMIARTEKGEKARRYFIECEKKLNAQLPQTFAEALRLAADKQEALELEQAKVQNLEQALDTSEQWISIIRAAKQSKVKETAFQWQVLKAYSLDNGIEIKKAPCPRFGTKNLYHVSVFKKCYPNLF